MSGKSQGILKWMISGNPGMGVTLERFYVMDKGLSGELPYVMTGLIMVLEL